MRTCRRKILNRAICLCLLLGAFAGAASVRAQTTGLDRWVGVDLWKSPLPEDQRSRLDQIIGQVPKGDGLGFTPWHVWKTNRNSITRYVVLLGNPELTVPGRSSACVFLFDDGSRRMNTFCFPTGYRVDLDSASFEFSTRLGADLLVLRMVHYINGRDIAREYFALRGDRLQFVRLEDENGEAIQNDYGYAEVGFAPAATNAQEWIGMLRSAEESDILSGLMFLGGGHIAEPRPPFTREPTEGKYAKLFLQLVGDPRISELISELTHSSDDWIRQAALLAARDARGRP